MTFQSMPTLTFEQVEWYLQNATVPQNTFCGMVQHELNATEYQVVLPLFPCEPLLVDIPDGATGNLSLAGNRTLGPNETLNMSTQLQIHLDDCVLLEGQLNLTIKSDAVAGKQPLITTSNPCLNGTFSEFHYQIEDNPPICSAQLEQSPERTGE